MQVLLTEIGIVQRVGVLGIAAWLAGRVRQRTGAHEKGAQYQCKFIVQHIFLHYPLSNEQDKNPESRLVLQPAGLDESHAKIISGAGVHLCDLFIAQLHAYKKSHKSHK
jgi:hypothetical protein